MSKRLQERLLHRVIKVSGLVAALFLGGCVTEPPMNQNSICAIFQQYPHWYWESQRAYVKWGLPVNIQMAMMRQESSFRADARPPRQTVMGFIPGPRPTSAYGYAQATDGTWARYQKSTGAISADRDQFGDAVDFMGWYADQANKTLGISKTDTYDLYLAYHEGLGGYRSGSYRQKPWLMDIAHKVARTADIYQTQLSRCQNTIPKPSNWNQWLK